MKTICPAILVDNKQDFIQQFNNYKDLFDCIDIDINIPNDDFEGEVTIGPIEALLCLENHEGNNFNLHLMVSEPVLIIDEYISNRCLPKKNRILIHQESNFKPVLDKYDTNLDIGIVVKAESNMKDIEFYKQFSEVQLMTIITGKQGNPFIPEVLDRVEWLREEGFEGIISLDGSVNLQSAQLIRNFDVSRVSVGSFFSKAENLELNKQKLELALNM